MCRHEYDLVVIGDSNTDIYARVSSYPAAGGCTFGERLESLPGGTAVNTAVAAARLGLRVAIATVVGHDAEGQAILDLLQSEGVDARFAARVPQPTGCVFVALGPGEEHTFFSLRVECADWQLRREHIPFEAIRESAALYVSGVSIAEAGIVKGSADSVLAALRIARDAGATTFLDPNLRLESPDVPIDIAQAMETCIRTVDYYMPNESEMEALALRCGQLHGRVATVVKQGSRGCTVISGSGRSQIAAKPVRAVDTTGAGDSFNAGFIAGILGGRPADGAGRLGAIVAGITVSRVGTISAFPTRSEVEQEG
ncbi:MAG TPA: sugar kinase [Bacillota bacterium]|jgi:ribokinase|nr:sugar kinase [Bacillota bacterium]